MICRVDQLLQLYTGTKEEGRKDSHRDPANIRKVMIRAMLIVHETTIQATFSDLTFLMLNKSVPNFSSME